MEIAMNHNASAIGTPRFFSRRAAVFGVLIGVTALCACESQQQQITEHEDKLSAAGFVVKPANTPERQAMLMKLPAHKFLRREKGDVVHYVYSDPLVCGCLYVGTQEAYNQYKANELAQHLADERQLTADTYEDSAWNWGAWGPWGGYPFPYGAYGW
jgi:hypothetical protein